MITLSSIDELNENVIRRAIKKHRQEELPRLQKLEKYYNAKNDILNRTMSDSTKPNNKIANAYGSYITDTLVGYFMGEPVTYNSNDSNLLENIRMIFEYNDEADENLELAKNMSIYGVAYEMIYIADSEIRFSVIDTKQCIPIYDDTIEKNLIAFIRYYEDYDIVNDKTNMVIEVITDSDVFRYITNSAIGDFILNDSYSHYFSGVPIAIYKNNEQMQGDFEMVISLIDAYDKLESDSLNDFEYLVDCYLVLYGFTADEEDVKKMKENRLLLMDEGTSAEWLIKNVDDTHIENLKTRIDSDIHKFAKCPNMADKEFASNSSGIAIQYKLLGTENKVAIKERKFKKGLQQRLELLSNIESVLGDGFDWRAVEINFTRNIPTNDADIADMVYKLKDIVSQETLLAQIPFIDDITKELERLEKEKMENPFFQSPSLYADSFEEGE